MEIQQMLQQYWPEWQIIGVLGAGSYGKVYHVQRKDMAGITDAAIKVTRVPHDDSEYNAMRMENMSQDQVRTYLRGVVQDLSVEIRAMESVKGYTNIVSIEDYKIIEQEEGLTWYILIRMALLTPLNKYQQGKPLNEADVIRLGKDLCTALTVCKKKNIVHRDIKPENIFINEQGDFVLGDFGVARNMERLTSGMTRIGTYNYMAPELFNNTMRNVDINSAARMDIYSLGLVMYQLMNDGRLPLMQKDAALTPQGRQDSLYRRMKGEALPAPCKASARLADIILKACAFAPEDRYPTAEAMRQALDDMSRQAVAENASDKTIRVDSVPGSVSSGPVQQKPSGLGSADVANSGRGRRNRRNRLSIIAVAFTVLALGIIAAITLISQKPNPTPMPEVTSTPTPGDTPTPVPEDTTTPVPEDTPTPVPEITPTPQVTQTPMPVPEDDTEPANAVVFSNSTVENAVREILDKPEGYLLDTDLDAITMLRLSDKELTDISDLAMLTHLTDILLDNNRIEDVSPLAGLTELTELDLSYNQISDIAPLAGLANLEKLWLHGNQIVDIAPLSGLENLNTLYISENQITDVTPLAGLGNLKTLSLDGNDGLTDTEPLMGLALETYEGPQIAPAPTLEPFVNHYTGEMPPWPSEKDALIFGMWRSKECEVPHIQQAYTDALTIADISSIGNIVVPNENSAVRLFNKLIAQSGDARPAGIVLSPYAGIDYTECMRAAAEAGVAVYVVPDGTPTLLFDELCGLYGIEGRVFHCDGDTPWPRESDASILFMYRDSDDNIDILDNAISKALNSAGHNAEANIISAVHKKGNAIKALVKMLEQGLGEGDFTVDAVCVFPYADVDYTPVIDKANEKGVALHFIESSQPGDIGTNIEMLYKDGDK